MSERPSEPPGFERAIQRWENEGGAQPKDSRGAGLASANARSGDARMAGGIRPGKKRHS